VAMKIKIKNTSQKDVQELAQHWLNIIVYGEPGAGKTMFGGSADKHPETGKVLIADVEAGKLSLEEMGVDYTEIQSFEDILELYDFLYKYVHYRDIFFNDKTEATEKKKARMQLAVLFGVEKKEEALKFEPPMYRSVVIDQLTELQKVNMSSLMDDVISEHPDRDPDVPSVREWGKSSNQLRQVIRKFRSLKMHTIFLVHLQTDKDETTGEIQMLPSLPGKLAREVPGYVDIVGYLEGNDDKGKFQNQLYTRPFGKHKMLKDRTQSLGAGLKMPTVGKIIDAWEAKRKGKVKKPTTTTKKQEPVKKTETTKKGIDLGDEEKTTEK